MTYVNDLLKKWKSQGVVGIKIMARPYTKADKEKAKVLFNNNVEDPSKVKSKTQHSALAKAPNPILEAYLLDEMLEMCADLDLVIAVHAGMWGDFRKLDPKHMIPVFMKHPNTRFDLYHMGMPWVRDTGIIGKNFPNVWLNLCWSHIISPKMAITTLDEWVDLVPTNKIIGFGGDYGATSVECVYGHLVIARENITKVLGGRIEEGRMNLKEAISLAEDWFYNVPKDLYKL